MPAERNILLVFAHPAFQKSRVNRRLLDAVRDLDGVLIHDLYEAYPDFQIDVEREQDLLRKHDVILLQHPFYWYSGPALLKEWMDLVFQYGFAFGHHGLELQNKYFMQAITTGGGVETYTHDGANHFSIRELLAPFEQTARLCYMHYVAPYVVYGTHRQFDHLEIVPFADQYRALVSGLRKGSIDVDHLLNVDVANDMLPDLPAQAPQTD